jgi:hypothetical protein
MCVCMQSHFVENHPIWILQEGPLISELVLSHSHGPNHRLYGFGSRESHFVPRCFGYGPHPHRGDHFPCRPGFSARASHTHFEPKRLTRSSGEVLKIAKTFSGRMVKCWIPKIYLTNPNNEPSTFSRPM